MPSFTFAQMLERDTKAAAARALRSQSGCATVAGDSCASLGSVSSVGPGEGPSFEAALREALFEQMRVTEAERLASRRQSDQALRGRRAVVERPSSAWRDGDTERLDLTKTVRVAAPHVCVWCAEPDEEPLVDTSRPGAPAGSRGSTSGGLEVGGTRLAWSAPLGAAIDATAAWLSPDAPVAARGRIGVLCWDENSTSDSAELSAQAQRAQAGGAVALLLLLLGERGRRWVPAREESGRRPPLGGGGGAAAELLPIDGWAAMPCVALRGPHAVRLREALRRCGANLDALPLRLAPTRHAEAAQHAAARHAALAALHGPPLPAKPSKLLRPSCVPLPDGVDDWIRLVPMGDDPPPEEELPLPRKPPSHAHFWERQTVAQPNHFWGFPTGAVMPTPKGMRPAADPDPEVVEALARAMREKARPRPGIFADGRPPSAPPKPTGVPHGPGF